MHHTILKDGSGYPFYLTDFKLMNIQDLLKSESAEHITVATQTVSQIWKPFQELCELAVTAVKNGNKIIFFGNGGSAADAQHLAAELIVRYRVNRAPIAAISITTDTSIITAGANDFGYDTIFENQLRALGKKGDIAIGLTTSGNSKNVLKALSTARELGITPAAFSGGTGGKISDVAHPIIIVPSTVIARIQEMHIFIGHVFCDVLEQSVTTN